MASIGISEKFSLRGKSYIVTGGAMGIGYHITKDIAEMGGNVAVLDLRDSPLEDVYGLAKKFNVKAEYFQADVSSEESLKSAFDKAVQSLGKLDGIVTAAGIAIDKPFVDQKWEEVNKVIQVNVSLPLQITLRRLYSRTCKGNGLFLRRPTDRLSTPKAKDPR